MSHHHRRRKLMKMRKWEFVQSVSIAMGIILVLGERTAMALTELPSNKTNGHRDSTQVPTGKPGSVSPANLQMFDGNLTDSNTSKSVNMGTESQSVTPKLNTTTAASSPAIMKVTKISESGNTTKTPTVRLGSISSVRTTVSSIEEEVMSELITSDVVRSRSTNRPNLSSVSAKPSGGSKVTNSSDPSRTAGHSGTTPTDHATVITNQSSTSTSDKSVGSYTTSFLTTAMSMIGVSWPVKTPRSTNRAGPTGTSWPTSMLLPTDVSLPTKTLPATVQLTQQPNGSTGTHGPVANPWMSSLQSTPAPSTRSVLEPTNTQRAKSTSWFTTIPWPKATAELTTSSQTSGDKPSSAIPDLSSRPTRNTRETTTQLDKSRGNCQDPEITAEGGAYSFIQPIPENAGQSYTRLVLRGVGSGGGHSWNITKTLEAGDDSVLFNFGRQLIPGEHYSITREWCTNETCPQDGVCPPFGPISKDFNFDAYDTVSSTEAESSTAFFNWTLWWQRQAYIPSIHFRLNLTNDGTSEERDVPTFNTEGPYSTGGSFEVGNLSSGARYILDFGDGSRPISFVTVPSEPQDVNHTQVLSHTADFSWYQPGFADSFTVTYEEVDGPTMTAMAYNSSIRLENLKQNTTYILSVVAQTENYTSMASFHVFNLNPPKVTSVVTGQGATWISLMVHPPEIISRFALYVNNVEKFTRVPFDMTGVFNITGLRPGIEHLFKFVFHIQGSSWKQQRRIATAPLPPASFTVDNSVFGYLDACWSAPKAGDFNRYEITFNSSNTEEVFNVLTPCHQEWVEGGIHYIITIVTISNGIKSEPKQVEIISKPAPPTIVETDRSPTSIELNVSCSPLGLTDKVHYELCRHRSMDAVWKGDMSCHDNRSTSVWYNMLDPGERYQFKAKSSRSVVDLRAESDIVFHNFTTYPLPPTNLLAKLITGLEITLAWLSTCLHCNFTVRAVPLNKTLNDIVKFSSCEDRVRETCEYSLVLPPEELYDITATSVAWGEESLTGSTVYNISMPTAIKHVTNIKLRSVTPTVVSVGFSPPEVPLEVITHYVIEYQGTRYNGDSCPLRDTWVSSTDPLPINVTVKGGCMYNFTIQAYFGTISGDVAWETVITETGVLEPTTQLPRYPGAFTHHSFEVTFDPKIFDDENGPVYNFTVVVAEAIEDHDSEPLALTLSLPGWAESISHNPIPPYQAFPEHPVYENGDGIFKRSITIEKTLTIGNEICGDDAPRYCNGHLIGGKTYIYWFRGFNSAGFTDTKVSPEFQLPKNQSILIIVCLIILMILFLIVIVLAFLLLRKKLQLDTKGTYQPTPTDGVNLKSLTRKTSTRAKYIRAIKLTEFCQDFHIMSGHSNYGYSQEFELLRRVGKKMTCNDAVLPENVSKNRYTNILPFDKTRVKLGSIDDELGSDYINANYIPGFSSPREYIACQGPLPGTVDDMWRMIWEMNVSVVVMVTQLVEKGKVKCEQYWPEDHRPVLYGDIQVTMTTMNETEAWNFRDFSIYKASTDQRKRVKHFNYLSWPDHGVPENGTSLLNFIETVREATPKDGAPIVVHCSAGCGRTGTFICLDQLLQQIEQFDYVNILGTSAEMRSHRQHMIQTEQQYVFIHRCVLDILEDNGLAPRPSSIMMNGNTGGALLMEMV